jgi:hypothetical protein
MSRGRETGDTLSVSPAMPSLGDIPEGHATRELRKGGNPVAHTSGLLVPRSIQ